MFSVKEKINQFLDKNSSGVVFFIWPTASGKTQLSLDMIKWWINAEVVNADSRQIYKYMDIWTDKVSKQIRDEIPHHIMDVINPNEFFTAWDWKKLALEKISEIQKKGKVPFVVGWTGLYTDTIYKNYSLPDAKPDFAFREKLYKLEEEKPGILWEKLNKVDPKEASKLHPHSVRYIIRALEIYEKTWKPKTEVCYEQDVPFPILMIIKWAEKDIANPKINKRVKQMFETGLVEEVENLLNMWYTENDQWMQAIGYKEVIPYIKGEYDKEKAIELVKKNTHYYAKKQRTFFRRYIADMKNPKKNVEYLFLES